MMTVLWEGERDNIEKLPLQAEALHGWGLGGPTFAPLTI